MKAGMQRFGTKGVNEVSNELKHLHICNKFEALDPHNLSKEEYFEVLESQLFLKYKRGKTTKGRTVYSGNEKHRTIDKEDAASPTTSIESVILPSKIDAEESKYVEIVDTPNILIQTRIEDEEDKVIIHMRGKLDELLIIPPQ